MANGVAVDSATRREMFAALAQAMVRGGVRSPVSRSIRDREAAGGHRRSGPNHPEERRPAGLVGSHATVAIYPLSPEMCASLIVDAAFFYVGMYSTEIIDASAG